MLKLNLRRVFTLRGIDKPMKFMMEGGISRTTSNNLLNNLVNSINSKHLEILCEILNCEPNDLYEWMPSANTQNAENHPLKNLRRTKSAQKVSEMLRNIPLDKISRIESLLGESAEKETPDEN